MAERKVRSLIECGARVTVISPFMCVGLRRLSDEGRIEAIWREYHTGDLVGAFLVIAATDSEEINAAVAEEAEKRGALVNVVDDPNKGNLLVPAVARQGDLAVSISTSGRSPALAKKLRLHVERALIPDYAQLLDVVTRVRDKAKRTGVRASSQVWHDLLSSDILDLVRHGKAKQAEERMLSVLVGGKNGAEPKRAGQEGPRDIEPSEVEVAGLDSVDAVPVADKRVDLENSVVEDGHPERGDPEGGH